MKQKLLPAAIIAASAFSTTAIAANNISFYGKANVSLNQQNEQTKISGVSMDTQDNWEFNSNSSRLGVKGSYEISENLKAIYKLEYEVFIDDGDDGKGNSSEFSQRNIYAGFQGNWGTFVGGKHDTPTKLAQGKVDRFNDMVYGDIKNIMVGENRESNILMYTTPKMGGFSATLAAMPGEDDGTANNDRDGLADATSLVVSWKNDNIYLAIANDNEVKNTDLTRVVGEFKADIFKIGALYQTAEVSDKKQGPKISSIKGPIADLTSNIKEQDAYLLSGEVSVAKAIKLKAQYGYSESTPVGAGAKDIETTQIAFGADYKLNKQSKLYAYYAQIDSEQGKDEANYDTFAVGYEIKF